MSGYEHAPHSLSKGPGVIFREPVRTFMCPVCGLPGETTSRVQITHAGECHRLRARQSDKRMREKRRAEK